MTTYEWLTVAISFLVVAIGLAGFYAVWKQLGYLAKQMTQADDAIQQDHKQRRREATFAFALSTRENYYILRDQGLPVVTRPDEVSAYLKAIPNWTDDGDNRNMVLVKYLGPWETVATGVNIGAYEFDVVDRLNGPEVARAWTTLKDWILVRRDWTDQPCLYAELECLAARITNR